MLSNDMLTTTASFFFLSSFVSCVLSIAARASSRLASPFILRLRVSIDTHKSSRGRV